MRKFFKVKKRNKTRKTHEVISSVLNPTRLNGNHFDSKRDAFYRFLVKSTNVEFEKSIDIILKDNEVFSYLNQSKSSTHTILAKEIISEYDIDNVRLVKLYKSIFKREIEKLMLAFNERNSIEDLFIKGKYDEVSEKLDTINNACGISLWEINFRIAILTAKNEYKSIDDLLESWKANSQSDLFHDLVRVTGWKSHSVDASMIIETMVRRSNKEFIEGGALNIAAFYSINCLQYPLYDDVEFMYSLNWLQKLPLIDLFDALQLLVIHSLKAGNLSSDIKYEMLNLFVDINKFILSKNIKNLINHLNTNETISKSNFIDIETQCYLEGDYQKIIYRLENNLQDIDNVITKINIFAKSYIYLNRTPKGLPSLLNSIITNLIAIYSLKNANQAISQQKNLAIIYSSLEMSDHLVISIMKSAPFFLESKLKDKIIHKCLFLNTPLTPLAYHLDLSPSLFINYLIPSTQKHRIIKNSAIESILNGHEDSLELIKKYLKMSPIKKDAIELFVEYFIREEDIDGLLECASNELIYNPNSNICLPLEEIAKHISEENIYSLNAVICTYYFNKYSADDNSDIFNEVFEEYILTRGVERPSELVSGDMSDKEIILLKDIAKIDVMDYLGCFDDDNDLKIERINILNRLVVCGYVQQSEIDVECKYIVDDILIESEAAKFNDGKIFVDTKSIFDKRKSEIDSFLMKYHGANNIDEDVQYEIESMTVLKGDKNVVIGRMINMLLVEFLNNKEFGLDINLSSEIRHGFFGNLICSSPQNRFLITELDDHGQYKSNNYWLNYYKMINDDILSDVDSLLINFTSNFNKLIETAENWMTTSLTDDEESDKVFVLNFTVDDFGSVRNLIESYQSSEDISKFIFKIFNEKLKFCMTNMKSKLNLIFASQIDDLFSELIEDINEVKGGTSMSDLLEEINVSNTEVKENIRTVCEWFSFKKSTHLDSIDLEKLVLLAEKCFKQINNINIDINIQVNQELQINGAHLYALVLCMINCFNNSYKYSIGELSISVVISGDEQGNFSLKIKNRLNSLAKIMLQDGKLTELAEKLKKMDNNDLLINNGGSGLYKSLHGLKKVSNRYNLSPYIYDNDFIVEITYGY